MAFGFRGSTAGEVRNLSRDDKVLHAETGAGNVVVDILIMIRNGLDAQKSEPQHNREYQRSDQPSAVTGLRGVDAHGYGEAGEIQHQCVGGSQRIESVLLPHTKAS